MNPTLKSDWEGWQYDLMAGSMPHIHQDPIWVPACIPDVSFSIQLPACGMGGQWKMLESPSPGKGIWAYYHENDWSSKESQSHGSPRVISTRVYMQVSDFKVRF